MAENYGVGIQSFAELMRTKCIYVDKTPLIYSLLQKEGIKNYFLSRPRRFGKSLLISTLKAIFQGKQELFQGFYIYDKIEWESYPIIHLSMSDMNFVDLGLTIDCYIVSFPNKEVKESFNEMLLGDYIHRHSSDAGISVYNIRHAFQENDLDKVKQIIQAMFHSLPVDLFEKKDNNGQIKPVGENFYHAIIYLIFNLLGVKMLAEVLPPSPQIGGQGGEGRIDALVETAEHIYLFEFKKDRSPELAIEQIKTNQYFGKYLCPPFSPQFGGKRGAKQFT